ncbi:MAG TPA: Rho termination factor N-terminal domain-containing protein [Oscillospiraceae bacterium]|nr:Rho termination factor N-terminal domain-containing protein [Oscillospiraceae bacterium]
MPASAMPVDLEAMTKTELMDFANEHGIEGLNARMLKADIIVAIKGAMGWM